jgi:hypothetical protein
MNVSAFIDRQDSTECNALSFLGVNYNQCVSLHDELWIWGSPNDVKPQGSPVVRKYKYTLIKLIPSRARPSGPTDWFLFPRLAGTTNIDRFGTTSSNFLYILLYGAKLPGSCMMVFQATTAPREEAKYQHIPSC